MQLTQTLWIPFKLPGMNEIVGSSKASGVYHYKAHLNGVPDGKRGRGKYGRVKRGLEDAIILIAKTSIRPVKLARFSFLWVEADRRRDPDNIHAGAKIVFDALIRARIIPGDGWSYIVPPIIHDWKLLKEVLRPDINSEGVLVTINS